jgi:hypothetical protein
MRRQARQLPKHQAADAELALLTMQVVVGAAKLDSSRRTASAKELTGNETWNPYGVRVLMRIPDLTMCGGGEAVSLDPFTPRRRECAKWLPTLRARNGPDQWPWRPEQAAMSQMSVVKAERARQNRAYVRELLRQRQPGFAVALASAEQDLSCQGSGGSRLDLEGFARDGQGILARREVAGAPIPEARPWDRRWRRRRGSCGKAGADTLNGAPAMTRWTGESSHREQ